MVVIGCFIYDVDGSGHKNNGEKKTRHPMRL